MSEVDVMLVFDTMSQMFETLVKRIEMLERRLEEACSCRRCEKVRDLADSFKEMHQ